MEVIQNLLPRYLGCYIKGRDLWDSQVEDLFLQNLMHSYFCILTPGIWAPLAYPVPPPSRLRSLQKRKGSFKIAKEAPNTIKSYGWYSGLCLVATVRQLWNSYVIYV